MLPPYYRGSASPPDIKEEMSLENRLKAATLVVMELCEARGYNKEGLAASECTDIYLYLLRLVGREI